MNYVSVCSGIEAASVAWHPLGWKPLTFAEIAPFPSAVLAHHYPGVPNAGDFTTIQRTEAHCDLLVGGTPCQAFSIAGLRGGLSDARGNLALEFCRLADRLRPRWILWENVPGVLSSNRGRDFSALLGALASLGYGFAWRVLDAQFYGVPQRRRRVFLVCHLGDWRRAAAVLFERESLRGNPPTRGEAREDVAGALGLGAGDRRRDLDGHGAYIPEVARCLTTKATRIDGESATFVTAPFDETQVTSPGNRSSCDPSTAALTKSGRPPAIAFNARQDPVPSVSTCGALTQTACEVPSVSTKPALSVALRGRDGGATAELGGEQANALRAANGGGSAPYVLTTRVRRLTPRECERLQGFPDDWTAIPYKRKPAKDAPRYHALGNSMAVPVMHWIGKRLAFVDSL